jgi:hypothetical protein
MGRRRVLRIFKRSESRDREVAATSISCWAPTTTRTFDGCVVFLELAMERAGRETGNLNAPFRYTLHHHSLYSQDFLSLYAPGALWR